MLCGDIEWGGGDEQYWTTSTNNSSALGTRQHLSASRSCMSGRGTIGESGTEARSQGGLLGLSSVTPKSVLNSCSNGCVQPPWVLQSVGDQTGCDHEDDFEKSSQQLQVVLCSLEVTSLNSQCLQKPQSHSLSEGLFCIGLRTCVVHLQL